MFGDGHPEAVIILLKKFLWKNYLKKCCLYMLDMVCEQCEDHNVTSALVCKTLLPEHLNINIKSYLKCEMCKRCNHRRFSRLSRIYDLNTIIWTYKLKNIKPLLQTTKTKQQLNKYSIDYIRYITQCIIVYYKGGHFYENKMKEYQQRNEAQIRIMKAQHEINLKTFFVDFYKEICNKKMKKEDALFMEKYIAKLLS